MSDPTEFKTRLATLELMIFDVDGVLTDGRLYYQPNGEELKVFHVHDGHGLKQLLNNGIEVAIISGRDSQALRTRLKDLGISHAYLGESNKIPALQDLIEKTGIALERTGYMGDDEPDLKPMQQVGISFAPSSAVDKIQELVDWVSSKNGGEGAVREVCDLVLAAKNIID
jgi:3-deoxy-D-manno-octulosonate 8-phosphate phosphatase (KDO 8-P phosphatase)